MRREPPPDGSTTEDDSERDREVSRQLRPDGGQFPPILQRFPDPVVRFAPGDDGLTVQAVNPAFEHTFTDEHGLEGTALRDVLDRFETEGDPDSVTERLAAGEEVEVELRDEQDGARYFRLRPVDVDGGPAGWLVISEVTDYRRPAQGQDDQADLLEEFASVVSHDLRNPLDVAKARLDAAQRTGEEVHLEKVALAHDRMEQLIGNVLTLARQGRTIDERVTVPLAALVHDAWATVATADASLEVEGDLPVLRADPSRLQELLENLFRNAIEHGGEAVTVRVGTTAEGFYVADDGPGIPASAREQVFEPGYSSAEGTGLGLAIVERIANAHGWRLAVTEAEGGGARFTVAGVEETTDESA